MVIIKIIRINCKILQGLHLEGISDDMKKTLTTCIGARPSLKSQITNDFFLVYFHIPMIHLLLCWEKNRYGVCEASFDYNND